MNILEVKTSKDFKLALLETVDGDGYGVELKTQKDKRNFLRDTFISEYGWAVERMGSKAAIKEWLRGLPSAISFPFYTHETSQVVRNLNSGKSFARSDNHDLDEIYWERLASTINQLMYGRTIIN